MLVTWTSFALAADAWIGGGLEVEAGYDDNAAAVGANVEGEVDARFEQGPVFLRLDYDLKLDLAQKQITNKGWGPEWAMLQIGRDGPRARLGVVNPSVGLEDWDDRLNYLPTTSACFDWGVGRILGADIGWQLADGPDLFVFGGYDLDYDAYGGGGGILYEGDKWGLWSGFAGYPELDQYMLIPSAEWYFGQTTLSVDTTLGMVGGSPYFTSETLIDLYPDTAFSPVARVEINADPGGVLDDPENGDFTQSASASLGFNFWPMRIAHADDVRLANLLKIQLEGRVFKPSSREGGLAYPGVFVAVTLWRPEPEAFTARYEESEEP
jgi:hypothetical protein